jgi:hypothetical protein
VRKRKKEKELVKRRGAQRVRKGWKEKGLDAGGTENMWKTCGLSELRETPRVAEVVAGWRGRKEQSNAETLRAQRLRAEE